MKLNTTRTKRAEWRRQVRGGDSETEIDACDVVGYGLFDEALDDCDTLESELANERSRSNRWRALFFKIRKRHQHGFWGRMAAIACKKRRATEDELARVRTELESFERKLSTRHSVIQSIEKDCDDFNRRLEDVEKERDKLRADCVMWRSFANRDARLVHELRADLESARHDIRDVCLKAHLEGRDDESEPSNTERITAVKNAKTQKEPT